MMFTRDEMKKIALEVKANMDILDSCTLHEFESVEPGKIGAEWRCKHCGGTVKYSDVYWYRKGKEHGRAK